MEETIVGILETLMNLEEVVGGIAGLILSIPVTILIGLLTLVFSVAPWVLVVLAMVWYVRSHKKKPEKKMTDFSKYAVTEKAARLFAEDFITDTLQGFENFANVRAPEYYCCRRISVARDVVYQTIPGEGVGQVTYARFEDEGFSNLPDDGHKREMCKALETKILEYVKNDSRMLNYRIESKFTAFNECKFEAYRKNPRYVHLVDWEAETIQQIKENEQKGAQIHLKQQQQMVHEEKQKQHDVEMHEEKAEQNRQEKVQSQETNEESWLDRLRMNPHVWEAAKISLDEMLRIMAVVETNAPVHREKIVLNFKIKVYNNRIILDTPHGSKQVFNCLEKNLEILPADAVFTFGFCVLNALYHCWDDYAFTESLKNQSEDENFESDFDEEDENFKCDFEKYENMIELTITMTKINPSYEPPKQW